MGVGKYDKPMITVYEGMGILSKVAWEEMGDPGYLKAFSRRLPEPEIGVLPLDEEIDANCYVVTETGPERCQRSFALGWAKYEIDGSLENGVYDLTHDEETGLWTFKPAVCEPMEA